MVRTVNKGRVLLIVVLALSLGLNALVVGAGLRLYGLRTDLLGATEYTVDEPREIRRYQNRALLAHKDDIRPLVQAYLEARVATLETATATPFDRAATEARMAEGRARLDALIDALQDILLDAFEDYAREQGRG